MASVEATLRRLIGRCIKMIAEVIAQYGAALLALSVVAAVFAYGERATLSTAPLWILTIVLFLMGARAFQQALKRSNQESEEHRSENSRNELRERQIIALLSAIAKSSGVDSEELLEDEKNKMRQDEKERIFDKVKRGDAL